MSYTPIIIVEDSTLKGRQHDIENAYWRFSHQDEGEDNTQDRAYRQLAKVLQDKPITLRDLSFHIVEIELTGQNAEFRKLLDKLKIEYTIEN